jgi:O-6-methylguanine DNA methyltransferase
MMKKIEYGFSDSPFGEIIVARTWDGICDMQFLEHNRMETIHELARRWGVYTPTTQSNTMAETVARVIFEGYDHELRLDLRGTDFQVRVWQELLNIPFGQTASYLQVAERLGNAKAVRAVASAIAQNPIAMLIPCHRVVHSDGTTGEYHWGPELKRRLIDWEAAAAPLGKVKAPRLVCKATGLPLTDEGEDGEV